MFQSESFGRHFWVDDEYEFRSCPSFVDNTGDFNNEDYVKEWDGLQDLNVSHLLDIYKTELLNKVNYAGSLSHRGK
tara:strand:+ start:3380 stop:3607 length:228 start_codon:yes stop_codon:yes gene_type:complete